MQQVTSGEALEAKDGHIVHQICFALQDQVGKDSASGRRVHHAVAAEAVSQEEARNALYRTEDRTVVGRHLIQTRPSSFWIDSQILKHGNTIGRSGQDLLNK